MLVAATASGCVKVAMASMAGYGLLVVSLGIALTKYEIRPRSPSGKMFEAERFGPEGQRLFRAYRLAAMASPLAWALGVVGILLLCK